MKKYYLYCTIFGKELNPSELETGISVSFEHKQQKGDISKLRNEPSDSGSASFYIKGASQDYTILFDDFIIIIDEIIKNDIHKKIEFIDLTLSVYYADQCAIGFDSQTLKKLGERNVSFAIDCYNIEKNLT